MSPGTDDRSPICAAAPGTPNPVPEPDEGYSNEILIAADGSVLFRHFDEELAELVLALDPGNRTARRLVFRPPEGDPR